MSRSACPRCGARLPVDAPWCSLCLTPVSGRRAAPAHAEGVTDTGRHPVRDRGEERLREPAQAPAQDPVRDPVRDVEPVTPAGGAPVPPDVDRWFDELRRQSPPTPSGWAGRLAGASKGVRALVLMIVMTAAFAVLTVVGSLMS